MNNTWQCGLLIANINGIGNIIAVISFQGSTTANVTKLFDNSGVASPSATINSDGHIVLKSANDARFTFANFTYIFM